MRIDTILHLASKSKIKSHEDPIHLNDYNYYLKLAADKITAEINKNNISNLYKYEKHCQAFDFRISNNKNQAKININKLQEMEDYSKECKTKENYLKKVGLSNKLIGKETKFTNDDEVVRPIKKICDNIKYDLSNSPSMAEIIFSDARIKALRHIRDEHNKTINKHLGFEPPTKSKGITR